MSAEQQNNCGPAMAPGNIVWFEIPSDNLDRSKSFYSELFGWEYQKMPGPVDYWHVNTHAQPNGGMMNRQNDGQRGITTYVLVESVDASSEKVTKLGGKICLPKQAVPGMGYFAVCEDTEGNTFGLWQHDATAN